MVGMMLVHMTFVAMVRLALDSYHSNEQIFEQYKPPDAHRR
jgi:hypothetical protein